MFTPDKVLAIRQQYADNLDLTYEALAAEHHCSPLTINLLIRGKTWKDVPGALPDNRGRGIRRGPSHPQAKLTTEQVRAMLYRYDKDDSLTYDILSKEYKVSRRVIAHAFRNLEQWLPAEELTNRASTRVRGARRGERHPSAQLNDKQIRTMRELRRLNKQKWTLSALAAEFGTCPSMASRVVRGKSRVDAGGPIEGDGKDWDVSGVIPPSEERLRVSEFPPTTPKQPLFEFDFVGYGAKDGQMFYAAARPTRKM